MKKWICVILALGLFLFAFAGCTTTTEQGTDEEIVSTDTATVKDEPESTSSGKTNGEITTVTYFTSAGGWKSLLESEVENWNNTVGAEKGIRIDMTVNNDTFSETLDMAIKGGNSPDIFYQSSSKLAAFVASNYVRPLDDVPGLESLLEEYADYLIPITTSIGGKTYTLPLEALPIKIAYNKDLFKMAGIVDENGEAKPPVTWDEVVEDARLITEAGGGEYFGIGFTWGWSVGVRRLAMKPYIASTGQGWFDNENGMYDFAPFKGLFEHLMQIKEDESYFPGIESIGIDPIRAQFAEGRIGMMTAPSYDVGVYNDQFPATCDWGVFDIPAEDPNNRYAPVMLMRPNNSISSSVTEDRLWAVAEAYKFLHSDELLTKYYEGGFIIPVLPSIVQGAANVCDKVGWAEMCDYEDYVPMPEFPDALIMLEGDPYGVVFQSVWEGSMTIDEAIEDLNTRYNEALDKAVQGGKVNLDDYLISGDYFDIN